MKKLFFGLVFSIATISAHASAPAALILETSTFVRFMFGGKEGTYKTQVYNDGAVKFLNNKDVLVSTTQMKKADLQSLKSQIEKLQSGELVRQKGAGCMDGPSIKVRAIKSSGTEILFKTVDFCQVSLIKGSEALAAQAEKINQKVFTIK